MRPVALITLSALASGALIAGGFAPRPAESDVAPHLHREARRLRAHFDSVDVELRQAPVHGLTTAQLSARTQLIGWLREYRDAGVFPFNDVLERRTPIFRDGRGVFCAMAYLIDRSGRGDVVDRIATSRNLAYIAELAGDPALVAWLDSTGLSVAEAGRIQPTYGPDPGSDENEVSAGVAIPSIVMGGAALATTGLNLFAPSRVKGAAGLLAGSGVAVVGLLNFDENGPTTAVAVGDLIVGALALGAGLRAVISSETPRPAASRSSGGSPTGPALAVAPGLIPVGGEPRLGIRVTARF